MKNNALTMKQEQVVNHLEKKGFYVNDVIAGDRPETVAVMMMKKPRRQTTWYAEVEADGSVNGQWVEAFLRGLK